MTTNDQPGAVTPVTAELASLGVPYRPFRHSGPVESLEQAARERGQRPEQVVRSLVFRLGQGDFLMVLMAGEQQVSWRGLRRFLGQSRLSMATEAELIEATGYQIGAVSPFGLPRPMRVLIDNAVLASEEVSLGSGERGLTVILRTEDLRRALPDAEIGAFGAE